MARNKPRYRFYFDYCYDCGRRQWRSSARRWLHLGRIPRPQPSRDPMFNLWYEATFGAQKGESRQ